MKTREQRQDRNEPQTDVTVDALALRPLDRQQLASVTGGEEITLYYTKTKSRS